jgi:hypothetical protein
MLTWILLGIGGLFGGGIIGGQIYAWLTNGTNPIWEFLGSILEFIPDLIGILWDVIVFLFEIIGSLGD